MSQARALDVTATRCVLLDIEGTICPISFVKNVLFPYALKALPSALAERWADPEFRPYRDAFPEDARQSPEALQAYVQDLTARDVKVAYLKNLQGYLWQTGYKTSAYTTPLFPDVAPTLIRWHTSNIKIAIYSSGSVFAQKLLFQHVSDGSGGTQTIDLSYLVEAEGWFDTVNAGPKIEKASYEDIARSLGVREGEVLFCSDNVNEIQAAVAAGMKAILVDREGNAPLSDEDRRRYTVVETLTEINLLQ